jgi:DNA-binding response OmpR family regulator
MSLTSKNMPTKIVVIDDNNTTVEALKTVLEPHKFFLLGADSSIEELNAVLRHDPDVFIIDTTSDKRDSITICKEIREKSDVPIVVLSAVNKPGMLERALNAGADEYLVKPVPANILIAHLKTLVRRYQEEQMAKYRYLRGAEAKTNNLQ